MEKRGKVILCTACMAMFTLATVTMSQAQNLLVDPGAESQTTGAGGIGGWGLFNGATFSMDVAHSGSWSIQEAGPGGFTVPGAFQTFAASAGQVFTMTGFGLTTSATANVNTWGALQITYFSGPNGTGSNLGTVETSPGNALVGNKVDSTSPPNTWIPLSVTATAPAGAQSMQGFALTLDATPITMYFDDMTLIPEPSTIALALTGLLGLVAFAWKERRI